MNRETWIPIAGLVGLFLAGTAMLYATSSTPPPPAKAQAEAAPKAKLPPKSKAPPVDAQELTTRAPVGARPDAPDGARNVVLVVVSAWRKDQLSPYGGPNDVTPWLGAMAEAGARFDDAVAAGGWSRPALVATTTGRHALSLGVVEPSATVEHVALPDEVETLAERLASAGWYTIGVNALPHTGRADGLAQGFDHHRDAHPQGYRPQNRLEADEAVKAAAGMLRARSAAERARPFLLELHLVDLHKPIRVPPSEFRPFEGPDHHIAPYRAVLHRVDRALAQLDAELKALGEADDTYFVVVGAVGEGLNMPPHHGHAHGRNLFPSTAEVGWLVRGPDVPAGSRVSGLASALDVGPTVLGLLGVDPALGEGSDWSAQVRSGGRTTRTEAIVDTWYAAADRAALYTPDRACIADFGSGNLEDGWADGCWDRAADPAFTTPIEAPALLQRLKAWRAEASAAGAVASKPR